VFFELRLAAAGDNPERLKNESTFAKLCGVSPLDASSGKHQRHRLNRDGDRQANSALWHIVFTRMVRRPWPMPSDPGSGRA
jgi:transposase